MLKCFYIFSVFFNFQRSQFKSLSLLAVSLKWACLLKVINVVNVLWCSIGIRLPFTSQQSLLHSEMCQQEAKNINRVCYSIYSCPHAWYPCQSLIVLHLHVGFVCWNVHFLRSSCLWFQETQTGFNWIMSSRDLSWVLAASIAKVADSLVKL